MMFSHVLIPLDGSAAAESAVAYAMLIPARIMTLMQVIAPQDEAGYDWLTDVADDSHHQQQRLYAEAYLSSVAARFQERGWTVRTLVAEGDPAEQIIAASGDASMILMTNHGQGHIAPAAYGQTVDRVARYSAKPVMVIRGGMASSARPAFSRVIVPLDGSEIAEEAAPLATEVAAQLGLPLHLVSVIDPALAPTNVTIRVAKQAAAFLASEAERLSTHAVEVTTEVRLGTPAGELVAVTGPTDLFVMTAFGAGTGQRWMLGGVADKLIRFADAPVLVIRPAIASRAAAA